MEKIVSFSKIITTTSSGIFSNYFSVYINIFAQPFLFLSLFLVQKVVIPLSLISGTWAGSAYLYPLLPNPILFKSDSSWYTGFLDIYLVMVLSPTFPFFF